MALSILTSPDNIKRRSLLKVPLIFSRLNVILLIKIVQINILQRFIQYIVLLLGNNVVMMVTIGPHVNQRSP